MLVNLITFTVTFIVSFITILFTPIIYNAFYNNIFSKQWDILYDSQNKSNKELTEIIIQWIKNIYEDNNKPSMIKIIIITLILNLMYALVLYNNIAIHQLVPYYLHIFGMVIFLSLGTLIMSFFQYQAYKININSLYNFSKDSKKIQFLFLIIKIISIIFILPSIFIFFLFTSSNNEILELIGTLIIYFSPLGSLYFLFNIEINIAYKFMLITPILSIISPMLFFIFIKFIYMKNNKILITFLEELDTTVRKQHTQNKNINLIIVIVLLIYQISIFKIFT